MRGGVAAAGALGLGACGVPAAYVAPGDRTAADRSAREHELDFANWPLYIDTDDSGRRRPTLDAFTRRTGIRVHYTEEINDNDEFFGKVSPSLMNHQSTDRDLIVISDWMCARFVRLGWVQEMDRGRQPHVARHLDPSLRDPAFDPGRRYTVPWQSGITGIAYNARKLGRTLHHVSELWDDDLKGRVTLLSGITGIAYNARMLGRTLHHVSELWDDDLKGRVTLLSGMDEAFALLLQGDGVDITRWTTDDFHRMCDRLAPRVRAGHIRRFTGNDYIKDLSSGDVLACQAYSGDVIQLQADNPDIRFLVPEEGAELWAESLMIPDRAAHKRNAERLIDYYYEPEVAAALAAWGNYVCPVPAARDVLAAAKDKETAALAEDPLVFPDDATRRRLAIARDITARERPELARRWSGTTGV
ncbi:spermidine/putrescine ABC transporter substrate-binding protein [Streptomyces sp. NEAU-H3]|uniref:polyamine ABC transporter substrate-binding protein n=1 Tax=Streptomyces sp. NEAU-H3 TaxID=2720636 RepID=UPI00143A4D48|nr:spermidine/putrescine ABC transporter substrate-binding protein [Streptomyces sp. NEAU-H3]NJA58206.1 spermidine/putrescine ABC transporter substrate-binding protein [Streptomyces sp. NEAU-H3]